MKLRLCVAALILVSPVAAQDMPLSQIIKEGDGWKEVTDKKRADYIQKTRDLFAGRSKAGFFYSAHPEKAAIEVVHLDLRAEGGMRSEEHTSELQSLRQ